MAKFVHDIQKKQHRERAQPQDRKRFGLLQKKKDYKLRSKDYHDKQERLKILKQKAKNKNPDEYYHAMVSRKTDSRGVLIKEREGSESLSVDESKLLKTQDVNYVTMKKLNEMKQIERALNGQNGNNNNNIQIGFESKGSHTVFLDDKKSYDNFDVARHFNTAKELVDKKENRLKLEQIEGLDESVQEQSAVLQKKLDMKKLKKLKNIKTRLERVEKLEKVEQKMNEQRELMKKGSKKKVVDKEGNISFKWKNQRKR